MTTRYWGQSNDCEKLTVWRWRAVTVTVPCPSILIVWGVISCPVIGSRMSSIPYRDCVVSHVQLCEMRALDRSASKSSWGRTRHRTVYKIIVSVLTSTSAQRHRKRWAVKELKQILSSLSPWAVRDKYHLKYICVYLRLYLGWWCYKQTNGENLFLRGKRDKGFSLVSPVFLRLHEPYS